MVLKTVLKYFIFFLILQGCHPFSGKKPKPVEYTLNEKPDFLKENDFELKIDSLDNFLYITFRIKEQGIDKIPFPKVNNAALNGTVLTFKLYCNGKEINGAGFTDFHSKHNYFGYSSWLGRDLKHQTDTIALTRNNYIYFDIPFYAFQKIKAGEQPFELKCSQDMFCSASKNYRTVVDSLGDTTLIPYRDFAKSSVITFAAKFSINIPPIFKTTVYSHEIELRNDSVYSPAGMDNTIWNSSYPDVYWTINFPGNRFYCSSDYQTSTGLYDQKDTFCLFHYTPNDSIGIGVWDHDNLSRDDYISFQNFSLNQFPDRQKKSFSFQNIKRFELKVAKEGCVNK